VKMPLSREEIAAAALMLSRSERAVEAYLGKNPLPYGRGSDSI